MKKVQNEREILTRLDAVLAYDILTDVYSRQEVADLILDAGGDPEAIGKRGQSLVAGLIRDLIHPSGPKLSDAEKTKSGP